MELMEYISKIKLKAEINFIGYKQNTNHFAHKSLNAESVSSSRWLKRSHTKACELQRNLARQDNRGL